jgi:hypothetical protein
MSTETKGRTCIACQENVTMGSENILCPACQVRLLQTLSNVEDLRDEISKMKIYSLKKNDVVLICNEQIRKHLFPREEK